MRECLYHPETGFYRRQTRNPFGASGDFYTAVQLMPVFGEVLAAYINQYASLEPSKFLDVVDLGAGRAGLAAFLAHWNYQPVDWDFAPWPAAINGIVIANEFFDALPVHLLQRKDDHWTELMVATATDGVLFLKPATITNEELLDYASRYGADIPDGGLLEVNLEMPVWLSRIAAALRQGRLLVIDYGYTAKELLRFPDGTLLSYRTHTAYSDVLAQPGERDITALVNFSELKSTAQSLGLNLIKEKPLASWVLDTLDQASLQKRWVEVDASWHMQWKQLVFGLGQVFRVLEFEPSK